MYCERHAMALLCVRHKSGGCERSVEDARHDREAFASQTARQVFLEMLRVVWCTRDVKMRQGNNGSLRVNRVVDFVKLSAASEGTFTSGEDDETEKKEEQQEENFVHDSAVWSSSSQTSKLKWLLRAVLKCDINRLGEHLAKELVGQCQTNLLRTIEEVIQNLGDESKMCESLHPFFGRSEYSGLVCFEKFFSLVFILRKSLDVTHTQHTLSITGTIQRSKHSCDVRSSNITHEKSTLSSWAMVILWLQILVLQKERRG